MNNRKKILIYHYGAIGDTIVTIPLIRNILYLHDSCDIDFINTQPVNHTCHIQLIEDLGKFHSIKYYPMLPLTNLRSFARRIRLFREIRQNRYKQAYVFFWNGVPKWWKILFRYVTGIGNIFFADSPEKDSQISISLRRQLKNYGDPLKKEFDTLLYPVSRHNIDTAEKIFASIPIQAEDIPFVMGISGKSAESFYWPQERYLKLLSEIVAEYSLFPVIIGAPSEKEKADVFLRASGKGVFISDLRASDAIAVMQRCSFYLGNDTGTMHMADSAGIPCITLFSNKDQYRAWFPEGDHHKNIIHKQSCGECHKAQCPFGSPALCIAAITVEEVSAAVGEIISVVQGGSNV